MTTVASLIKETNVLPEALKILLGKIYSKSQSFLKKRQYKYLLKTERFKKLEIDFLGKKLEIIDGPSFYSTYSEIFLEDIYKMQNLPERPYILDCGANIGLGTIYLKRQSPGAEVVCFEPDRNVFATLKKNILETFELEDVRLVNKGLWKEAGTLEFFAEGADGGRIKKEDDKSNIIKIEVVKLSDYINRNVDFLKIDIEGAEFEVLKEIEPKLPLVKNMFIEYHSFQNEQQWLPEILTMVKKAGFRINVVSHGPFYRTPMFSQVVSSGMDLQLNIFCTKN